MKLLRHPEDRWPLAYILMALSVQLGLSGYHTADPVKPGLYWPRLPELRERIPAELR